MKRLFVFAIALIATACVSNNELGKKAEYITEGEMPFKFVGKDFQGGIKKFEVQPAKNTAGGYSGYYSSKVADNAIAVFFYFKLIGIRHYVPKRNIERRFDNANIKGAIVTGPASIVNTNFGKADILPYEVAGENCIFIAKVLKGDRAYLNGYICYNQANPLSDMQIADIGNSLFLQ